VGHLKADAQGEGAGGSPQSNRGDILDLHTRNFVAAIKANDPSILAVWHRHGERGGHQRPDGGTLRSRPGAVHWDASANRFRDDAEANALMRARYRDGYVLPTA
jgi:hypothetical protein